MITIDTHLHTSFSSDSETPMEEMILQGIRLGMKTLCFTEHFDPDYPDNPEGLDFLVDFDSYYGTFLSLKEKYNSRIELLHGIEVGVQSQLGPELDSFYQKYGSRFDFIINSCHIVDGMDPYDGIYFQQFPVKDGLRHYFESILTNLKIFPHFQSAGHLDYISRYIPGAAPDFIYNEYQDILDEILLYLIENDKALEINTAGWKSGLTWPNPHIDILKRYRELGGTLITIGSDAHKPEHMAYDFGKLPELLRSVGFESCVIYRKQQAFCIPIST